MPAVEKLIVPIPLNYKNLDSLRSRVHSLELRGKFPKCAISVIMSIARNPGCRTEYYSSYSTIKYLESWGFIVRKKGVSFNGGATKRVFLSKKWRKIEGGKTLTDLPALKQETSVTSKHIVLQDEGPKSSSNIEIKDTDLVFVYGSTVTMANSNKFKRSFGNLYSGKEFKKLTLHSGTNILILQGYKHAAVKIKYEYKAI